MQTDNNDLENKVNEKNRITKINIIPEDEFLKIVYGEKMVL